MTILRRYFPTNRQLTQIGLIFHPVKVTDKNSSGTDQSKDGASVGHTDNLDNVNIQ